MVTYYLESFTGLGQFPFFIHYGYHNFSLDEHEHADFFELTTVLDGTAMLNVGDESIFIKKGDVFCVNDCTRHSFTECLNFKICNIMFRPEALFGGFPQLAECDGYSVLFDCDPPSGKETFRSRMRLNISDFDQAKAMTDAIMTEFGTVRPARIAAYTALFVTYVCFLLRRFDAEHTDTGRTTAFSKAVAFMESNFTGKATLDEIAGIAGFSVRQFQRQFRNTYLITPHEYLTALRMQKAMLMLTKSDESIGNIAYECGYPDPAFFTRSFKQYTGYSPKDYRSAEKNIHNTG